MTFISSPDDMSFDMIFLKSAFLRVDLMFQIKPVNTSNPQIQTYRNRKIISVIVECIF